MSKAYFSVYEIIANWDIQHEHRVFDNFDLNESFEAVIAAEDAIAKINPRADIEIHKKIREVEQNIKKQFPGVGEHVATSLLIVYASSYVHRLSHGGIDINVYNAMKYSYSQEIKNLAVGEALLLLKNLQETSSTKEMLKMELLLSIHLPKEQKDSEFTVFLEDRKKDFLGKGGYGAVYRVCDEAGNHFALKILEPKCSPDDIGNLERLKKTCLKEVVATKKINSSYVGEVLSFGFTNWEGQERMFLLSQYIDGMELAEFIRKNDNISNEMKINFLLQISQGIKAIHNVGVVHRDLSSRNVMVTQSGEIKVIDFGIAYFLEATLTSLSHTVTERDTDPLGDKARGNPPYMGPELWDPERYKVHFDKHTGLHVPIYESDVFAFGVIAFELFTDGRRPFAQGQSSIEIIKAEILTGSIAWPYNDQIPKKVKELIERCLEKEPSNRLSIDKIIQYLENDPLEQGTINTPDNIQELYFNLLSQRIPRNQDLQRNINLTLSPKGKDALLEQLLDSLENTPDWAKKPQAWNGAIMLADLSNQLGGKFSNFLDSLLPKEIQPWMISSLRGKTWARENFERWKTSHEISEMTKKAIIKFSR